jgi:hypothetical protein
MNTLDPNYNGELVTEPTNVWDNVWSAISNTLQASGQSFEEAESTTTNDAGTTSVDNWTEVWPASDMLQASGQSFSNDIKKDTSANGGVLDGLYTNLFEPTKAEIAA